VGGPGGPKHGGRQGSGELAGGRAQAGAQAGGTFSGGMALAVTCTGAPPAGENRSGDGGGSGTQQAGQAEQAAAAPERDGQASPPEAPTLAAGPGSAVGEAGAGVSVTAGSPTGAAGAMTAGPSPVRRPGDLRPVLLGGEADPGAGEDQRDHHERHLANQPSCLAVHAGTSRWIVLLL
jgi:hypothetical protein